MNKNNIWLSSLCILIIVLIGLLYFIKSNEGFVDTPASLAATTSLATAKESIATTKTAIDAANKAVGSSTEMFTSKDAHTKATKAVADANAAVSNTKTALGDVNIDTLTKTANTAKTNWMNAQKVVDDKNAPNSDYNKAKADVDPANPNSAVAKAAAAKARYDALPN